LRSFQQDLAVLAGDDPIGLDNSVRADQPCVDADFAAVRDDAPDVDGLVVRRGQLDAQCRSSCIDQLDAAACSQNDLAARAGYDAAVLHVGGDQIDLSAGGRGDRTLVRDSACARRFGKAQPSGQKVRIR
jgi:hypothetical protein